MKLQHLSYALLLVIVGAPLACGGTSDDVMLGNDHGGDKSSAGSDSAGTASAGKGSGGEVASGGSQSGGSQSGGKTGTAGSASAGTSTGGSGSYEPCAGKSCGANCTLCDPNDKDCAEAAVGKTCTAGGECVLARPYCGPPTCEGDEHYYAPGCESIARPSDPATPLVAGCYAPCSTEQACPFGLACVTSWYDPSAACEAGMACPEVCGATIDLCTNYTK